MKWPKAVSTAPKDIHVIAQHRGRVEVPPACRIALAKGRERERGQHGLTEETLTKGGALTEQRADLCANKGPCHGAGIQFVNVIGKAVCLSDERKVENGVNSYSVILCPLQSLLFHQLNIPFFFLI